VPQRRAREQVAAHAVVEQVLGFDLARPAQRGVSDLAERADRRSSSPRLAFKISFARRSS
jgi:hypothetical protein